MKHYSTLGEHFPISVFYDHPPMIGWLLALILKYSTSEYALRLPPLIFPYLVGAIIYSLLKVLDKNRARWAVILFLVSPIKMMNILVTTDTPLFLFASLLVAICSFTLNFLIAYIVIDPPAKLVQSKKYQQGLFYIKPQAIADRLKPYTKNYILTTESYSKSALLYYYTGNYISVFGPGSFHARHDDIYSDFRQFNKKNIIIVRTAPPDKNQYAPYFQTVAVKEMEVENITLYLVEGRGFKYEVYRELVLRPIKNNYYQIPFWLPTRGNYFTDKYFSEE